MWVLRIVFALDRTYRVNWQFSVNLPAAFFIFIFCIFPSTPRIAFCSSCDGFRAGNWGQAALGRGGCFSVTIHHPRLGMDGAGVLSPAPWHVRGGAWTRLPSPPGPPLGVVPRLLRPTAPRAGCCSSPCVLFARASVQRHLCRIPDAFVSGFPCGRDAVLSGGVTGSALAPSGAPGSSRACPGPRGCRVPCSAAGALPSPMSCTPMPSQGLNGLPSLCCKGLGQFPWP